MGQVKVEISIICFSHRADGLRAEIQSDFVIPKTKKMFLHQVLSKSPQGASEAALTSQPQENQKVIG